jgi:hypothetical protein
MHKVLARFSVGLFAIGLAGCTLHRRFPPQPAEPTAIGTRRLPLRVAVYEDRSLKFDYPLPQARIFVEEMNPGLAQTVRNAFKAAFHDVTLVKTPASGADADLVASPTLCLSDPMKLTVAFVDPRTGRFVAELSAERKYDATAPGVYSHLLTDVVLIAAVIAFPPSEIFVTRTIEKHDADRFNAGFAPAVATMAGDIADQASKDPRLNSFAFAGAFASSESPLPSFGEIGRPLCCMSMPAPAPNQGALSRDSASERFFDRWPTQAITPAHSQSLMKARAAAS